MSNGKKTQKQILATLKANALEIRTTLTVSIRKNAYGEYEARVRDYADASTRNDVSFADTFDDAVANITHELVRLHNLQQRGPARLKLSGGFDQSTVGVDGREPLFNGEIR